MVARLVEILVESWVVQTAACLVEKSATSSVLVSAKE